MPSNHSNELNGPHSQPPYNHFEQYSSQFPGMQPHAMNSSYGRNHGMYSEDENCKRSNSMYPSTRKNLHPQHHHEGFNRNNQSHSEPTNSGPNRHGHYMNQQHRGPGPSYSPPFQNGPFICSQRPSPPNRSSHGQSASFCQGNNRYENNNNDRCEEWGSAGPPPQLSPMPNSNVPMMRSR